MKLYSYFRSSAVYRVRIALNLKGLAYDTLPIHLLKDGGEQLSDAYQRVNPQSLVPALIDDDQPGAPITQSLSIIEYLDETHPEPALLPKSARDRAHVRSIALAIACDIHPLNNLRVMRHLSRTFGLDDDRRDAWMRHWCELGLGQVEALLASDRRTGSFCFGDSPGLADCFLIPQVLNARRVKCDLGAMPTITRIYEKCMTLDAFIKAAPENQPDVE